jgi:hypothetical protein
MKVIILILSLIFFPGVAQATTYTVCSSGCDSNTIQRILDSYDLAGGDIVEVRADSVGGSKTYYEKVTPGADDGGGVGNPVVIRARPGDTITIDGQDIRDSAFDILNANYITIDGFYMDNHTTYSIDIRGSGSRGTASVYRTGIIVRNCHINITTDQAIHVRYGRDCVIQNNTITTDDGSNAGQTDGIYLQGGTGNIVDGNHVTLRNDDNTPHCDGIQGAWEDNVIVRNNLFKHDNNSTANKQCIYLSESDGYVNVYNNVCAATNSTTGSNVLSVLHGSATVEIYNNTVYVNGCNSGILTDHNNPKVKNNIVYLNTSVNY